MTRSVGGRGGVADADAGVGSGGASDVSLIFGVGRIFLLPETRSYNYILKIPSLALAPHPFQWDGQTRMFRTEKTPEQVWPSFSNWPKLMKVALITAILLLSFKLLTDGLFLVSNLSTKTYQVDVFYWTARLLISAVTVRLAILGIGRKTDFIGVALNYFLGNLLLDFLWMRDPTDEIYGTFAEIISVDQSVSGYIYISFFVGIGISLIYCELASLKLAKSKKNNAGMPP